jgi:hypothetical protein
MEPNTEEPMDDNLRSFKGIMTGALVGVVILAALVLAANSYLNLPTVAVDIDGKCRWIEYSDGLRHVGCGDSLPAKYHEIKVASYD